MLTLYFINAIKDMIPTNAVGIFVMDDSNSLNKTDAIKASEAIFTPSNKYFRFLDSLNLCRIGFNKATKINEGKKIPAVDTRAPGSPFNMYPTEAAVVKTGPGVNCPIATASIS